MKLKIIAVLAITLISSAAVLACDYCLLTQGISPLETSRGIGFRLDERYTRLTTFLDNGREIPNTGSIESHWTTQATAFWSVRPKLTLVAVVPVVRRLQDGPSSPTLPQPGGAAFGTGGPRYRQLHGDEEVNGTTFGLGDISLVGRYQLFQKHSLTSTFLGAVQAGIRLPTGSTHSKNDFGQYLDAHIQPGTGAVAYLFGASFSYAKKRITLVTNSFFSIPTEGNFGDTPYKFGKSVNYDASLRYRLTKSIQSKAKFFASLGFAGDTRGKEKEDGQFLEDTGGTTFYFTPGFQIFYNQVIFEFSFWQPLGYNLNGEQLGETSKTLAGITFLLR